MVGWAAVTSRFVNPPAGLMGTAWATRVTSNVKYQFPNVRFCLLVGVGGGCPDPKDHSKDVRLGDVVVSEPKGNRGMYLPLGLTVFSLPF